MAPSCPTMCCFFTALAGCIMVPSGVSTLLTYTASDAADPTQHYQPASTCQVLSRLHTEYQRTEVVTRIPYQVCYDRYVYNISYTRATTDGTAIITQVEDLRRGGDNGFCNYTDFTTGGDMDQVTPKGPPSWKKDASVACWLPATDQDITLLRALYGCTNSVCLLFEDPVQSHLNAMFGGYASVAIGLVLAVVGALCTFKFHMDDNAKSPGESQPLKQSLAAP